MKRVKIGFWGLQSVYEFVKITADSRYELELEADNGTVNAKSLLSVLSVMGANAMELVIDGEPCDMLLDRLSLYIEHGSLLVGRKLSGKGT